MRELKILLIVLGLIIGLSVCTQAASPVKNNIITFSATIDGQEYSLEGMLYRPDDQGIHPVVIMNHGRNGKYPPVNPDEVKGYSSVCKALAERGYIVLMLVRRGYGHSQGPDCELKNTAVDSGLEAVKDVKSAVEFMQKQPYADKNKVVIVGHSQGGWTALASSAVKMDGVLGTVNMCGGTNYESMGRGNISPVVQEHWVWASGILGKSALVPVLWLYAENDRNHPPIYVNRMFAAFQNAGGQGRLVIKPPFADNGHHIVSRPYLFIDDLLSFFESIGATN